MAFAASQLEALSDPLFQRALLIFVHFRSPLPVAALPTLPQANEPLVNVNCAAGLAWYQSPGCFVAIPVRRAREP